MGMILDAIPRMATHPHLVALLRMFAQGESQPLARSAIELLGRTRAPEALLALDALTATLPSQLAGLADRNRRKLRLSGVRGAAAEEKPRRLAVFLSPVDRAGRRSSGSLACHGPERDTWLTMITRDPEGIVASFGAAEAPGDKLPPALAVGSLHALPQEAGMPPLQLLEAPFEAATRGAPRTREHWAANTLPPPEYRLLNPLIWNAGEMVGELPCRWPARLPRPRRRRSWTIRPSRAGSGAGSVARRCTPGGHTAEPGGSGQADRRPGLRPFRP